MIKWSASSNGSNSARFGTHSLRSGGATALYVRGISLGRIRRFGRWASDTFRRYLYHDNQVFRYVGSAMVKEKGLLDQLQMTQHSSKHVTIAEDEEEDENQFRVGGKITEVSGSDDENCPVVRNQRVLSPGCDVDDLPSATTYLVMVPGCNVGDLPSATTCVILDVGVELRDNSTEGIVDSVGGDTTTHDVEGILEVRWSSQGRSPERDSDVGPFCRKCGSTEHWWRDCPTLGTDEVYTQKIVLPFEMGRNTEAIPASQPRNLPSSNA